MKFDKLFLSVTLAGLLYASGLTAVSLYTLHYLIKASLQVTLNPEKLVSYFKPELILQKWHGSWLLKIPSNRIK